MTILTNNQPSDELAQIYKDNYYWYLNSLAYREAFLWPLGHAVNMVGGSVLDIACGLGWLAEYIDTKENPYLGFDGSKVAVEKASKIHKDRPECKFLWDRFEAPSIVGQFDTLVFGNILDVLVKKECQMDLVDKYIHKFNPRHIAIYELQRFDSSEFQDKFTRLIHYSASVSMDGIDEVKKHRKFEVFRCR